MPVVVTFAVNTIFNFAVALLVARFLGPEEYGRFALAAAAAVFINTALFDWIRLAATRFYSNRTREREPQVRATLDLAFGALAMALCAGAVALILSGVELQLSNALIALAAATAVANGLFDYHTALVRARFLDRAYGRLILAKNLAAIVFTVGGAWWLQSAKVALIGICVCVASALLTAREALLDPAARPELAERARLFSYMSYGLPIVAAGVLYQTIPLLNRALIADRFGFAQSGQFSLAYDMGVRLVAAIGSTVDVVLFQLAVRADEKFGRERAKLQTGRNAALVLAVVAPTSAGFWLILPSFEHLFVPVAFHGPFALYLTALLPGLFCFAMAQFAINPMFQIDKRTGPLIAAALIACAANAAAVALLPAGASATTHARLQSAVFGLGVVALLIFAAMSRPAWPKARDLAAIVAATATMIGVGLPLRALEPGAATLMTQIASGLIVCLVFFVALDVGGLRRLALARLWPRPA